MNRNKSVLAYIATHPGCNTVDVARNQGYTPKNASSTCYALFKSGRVQRREIRRLASNIPVYGYWPADTEASDLPNGIGNVFQQPATARRGADATQDSTDIAVIGTLLDDIAGLIADTLAGKIKAQLADRLRVLARPDVDRIGETADSPRYITGIDQEAAQEVAHPVAAANEPDDNKKPKVGLVGLYPNQIHEIKKEFGNTYRLHVWRSGDWRQLEAIAVHCEAVFVMIQQISHKISNHLKTNNANTFSVHGKIDALKVALYEYYEQGKVAA